MPGGPGSESRAPDDPPAVSAYTGRVDVPPSSGHGPPAVLQPEMPDAAGPAALLLPAEGAPR